MPSLLRIHRVSNGQMTAAIWWVTILVSHWRTRDCSGNFRWSGDSRTEGSGSFSCTAWSSIPRTRESWRLSPRATPGSSFNASPPPSHIHLWRCSWGTPTFPGGSSFEEALLCGGGKRVPQRNCSSSRGPRPSSTSARSISAPLPCWIPGAGGCSSMCEADNPDGGCNNAGVGTGPRSAGP